MKDIKLREWEESYERGENNILYPQEEVVRFLNRYIRKKLDYSGKFTEVLELNDQEKLVCLDFACGVGAHSILCEDFGIESFVAFASVVLERIIRAILLAKTLNGNFRMCENRPRGSKNALGGSTSISDGGRGSGRRGEG